MLPKLVVTRVCGSATAPQFLHANAHCRNFMTTIVSTLYLIVTNLVMVLIKCNAPIMIGGKIVMQLLVERYKYQTSSVCGCSPSGQQHPLEDYVVWRELQYTP